MRRQHKNVIISLSARIEKVYPRFFYTLDSPLTKLEGYFSILVVHTGTPPETGLLPKPYSWTVTVGKQTVPLA